MTKPNRRSVIETRQAKKNDLIKALMEYKTLLNNNIDNQNWVAVNMSASKIVFLSERLRQI